VWYVIWFRHHATPVVSFYTRDYGPQPTAAAAARLVIAAAVISDYWAVVHEDDLAELGISIA